MPSRNSKLIKPAYWSYDADTNLKYLKNITLYLISKGKPEVDENLGNRYCIPIFILIWENIYLGIFYSYVNKALGLFLRSVTIRHAFQINI